MKAPFSGACSAARRFAIHDGRIGRALSHNLSTTWESAAARWRPSRIRPFSVKMARNWMVSLSFGHLRVSSNPHRDPRGGCAMSENPSSGFTDPRPIERNGRTIGDSVHGRQTADAVQHRPCSDAESAMPRHVAHVPFRAARLIGPDGEVPEDMAPMLRAGGSQGAATSSRTGRFDQLYTRYGAIRKTHAGTWCLTCAPDGYTIQMNVDSTVTEFWLLRHTGKFCSPNCDRPRRYSSHRPVAACRAEPRAPGWYELLVWDGQTVGAGWGLNSRMWSRQKD